MSMLLKCIALKSLFANLQINVSSQKVGAVNFEYIYMGTSKMRTSRQRKLQKPNDGKMYKNGLQNG